MRAHARAKLARLAYQRALEAARREPTAARWARLLAAARNLRAALRDRLREASPGIGGEAPRPAGRVVHLPGGSSRWPELTAELQRARALVAWSRELVAEARRQRELVAPLRGGAPPVRSARTLR
jgi:hypothetical protein